MKNIKTKCFIIICFFCANNFSAFTSTVKFSNDFYAAQKFFYAQALKKFPKLAKDKMYPEVPIKGTASLSDLKDIMPLMDFFEARQKFAAEAVKYPEQIYPEIFAFLSAHPALSVSSGSKPKFEALEKYFLPFYYLFSSDKHYAFNPEIKTNPCPIIFYYKDDKKNNFSFSINNTSKKSFSFNINESVLQNYFTLVGKKPITLKAGSSVNLKFTVDLQKLKNDTVFKVFSFTFSDPSQPRVKIIVPVVLLPSKDFLSTPTHFFNFVYTYNTHFKNIDLYKDRTSGPENCTGNNCSGTGTYLLRCADRSVKEYSFGEFGTVQYNITTVSPQLYSSKTNALSFTYNELGTIDGQDRNCPGVFPESSTPCPSETPNNGKQLYGSRKIEFKIFLAQGKTYNFKLNLNYSDLKNQPQLSSELSWLQEKKIIVIVTDEQKKQIVKEFMTINQISIDRRGLAPGIYSVEIFPTYEDGSRLNPSFELSHLNHATRSRFDFTLKSSLSVTADK